MDKQENWTKLRIENQTKLKIGEKLKKIGQNCKLDKKEKKKKNENSKKSKN